MGMVRMTRKWNGDNLEESTASEQHDNDARPDWNGQQVNMTQDSLTLHPQCSREARAIVSLSFHIYSVLQV